MKKIYVDEKDLTEEEKKYGVISYKRMCERFFSDMILCNNIIEVDREMELNVEIGSLYDDEDDTYSDIYQYYLVNIDEWSLNNLKEVGQNDVILMYSEKLDLYVLGVTHFGTSWNGVMTEIKWTTNLDEVC